MLGYFEKSILVGLIPFLPNAIEVTLNTLIYILLCICMYINTCTYVCNHGEVRHLVKHPHVSTDTWWMKTYIYFKFCESSAHPPIIATCPLYSHAWRHSTRIIPSFFVHFFQFLYGTSQHYPNTSNKHQHE